MVYCAKYKLCFLSRYFNMDSVTITQMSEENAKDEDYLHGHLSQETIEQSL